jgi:hypothetical protein
VILSQSQWSGNLAYTELFLFHCIFFSRKPFTEFALDGEIIDRLKKLGFATAFEIQDKTLPLTLEGRLGVLHMCLCSINC